MAKKGFLLVAAPDTGGSRFQEGNVEILDAKYLVHHPDVRAGSPDPGSHFALYLKAKRLDQDLNPIMDLESEEPRTEDLYFSFGKTSLLTMHPGLANSPDDENPEDAGTADGTEGPTIWTKSDDVKPHGKTAAYIFFASLHNGLKDKDEKSVILKGVGMKQEILARQWAPDLVGCIFEMKNWVHPEKMERKNEKGEKVGEQDITYRVVTKIIRGPGEQAPVKAPAAAGKGATPAAPVSAAAANGAGGGNEAVQLALNEIFDKLSTDQSGKALSFKALFKEAKGIVDGMKLDAKIMLDTMEEYRKPAWLTANAEKYDMTVDLSAKTVTFG